MHTRTAAALGSLLLVLLCPASVPAQSALIAPQPGMGRLTVAAATPADLRSWDGTIDQSVRGGELVVSRVQEDPVLAGHRHETFVQSYWGIPVYGGSLVRQTAGGVTVSMIRHVVDGHHRRPDPHPCPRPALRRFLGRFLARPSWPPVRRRRCDPPVASDEMICVFNGNPL